MMKGWVRILPFFVVEWLSKRYGERFIMSVVKGKNHDAKVITRPFKGVYFQILDK